ncbi:MAG: Gfo/Idh/MocA family oxidoreductase [Gaiellaceae bacterium]
MNCAVVGLGYWGPNLVRNLHELEGAAVPLVCDLNESALSTIQRRYPAVRTTTDLADVLNDDDIEAVVIATPVSTHHELAAACLSAGKHVLVEKPLAGSTDEARDLIDLADRSGLVLMPGHTFLYSPPVNMIRDLIRSQELGEIYFISTSRVNLGLHQTDVSVIWDLGPHDFSILRYWLDEAPAFVTAASRDCVGSGSPDVAFITLEYDSGVIAHVELSWLAPSKLRRTTVVGSQKMVVYDDVSNEPVRLFDSGVTLPPPESFGEFRLTYRTGDIVSPRVESSEPLLLELRDFAQAVTTGGRPRSHAELGLDVVRVIETAHESLARGGEKVGLLDTSRPRDMQAL